MKTGLRLMRDAPKAWRRYIFKQKWSMLWVVSAWHPALRLCLDGFFLTPTHPHLGFQKENTTKTVLWVAQWCMQRELGTMEY